MSEFKVGDTVRVISGKQATIIPEGLIFIIEEITDYNGGFACGKGAEGGVWLSNLELVVPGDSDSVSKLPHYNDHPSGVETIEVVKHETFVRGNILKYVWRAPYKGNELQDLLKARYYLDLEIDRLENS